MHIQATVGWHGGAGPFCVEFACSSCVWVLMNLHLVQSGSSAGKHSLWDKGVEEMNA